MESLSHTDLLFHKRDEDLSLLELPEQVLLLHFVQLR